LAVERSGGAQSESFPARARHVPQKSDSIEHLHVYGTRGSYKPFVLAESVITQTDMRSGAHQTIVRTYPAPIHVAEGRVSWSEAKQINPESLKMHAEPDPDRRISPKISLDAVAHAALQSEDAFKSFVADREKLQLFQNSAFAMYSEPGEPREAFLRRCVE